MTQDEIIRMARDAGFFEFNVEGWINEFERFVTLVATHERNRLAWTQEHWTEYEHAIAAAEREACAKVCEDIGGGMSHPYVAQNCAAAIRARSNHG